SWDDAALVSVHSRSIEDIVAIVRASHKVGIFTDDKHTPAEIARVLLEQGVESCRAYVCQNLGTEQEHIVTTTLRKLVDMKFSQLCTVILVRNAKEIFNPLIGIPETSFSRKKGLITKTEVRAVSLSKLGLKENSIVWDIGAGSGAVSIEAASLAGKGRIFAIEKDSDCIAHIRRNIKRFGRGNITVIPAAAPEALDSLPDPTAVFVGGSGGEMKAILDCACRRLKTGGRIVVNAATLENLQHAVNYLKARGFTADITQVSIARSKSIAGLTRLEPFNPVFVISAKKAGSR
ncbi:MAG: precorrin-6Y C5,15-methyltransferase (decarboxylating) subunit CbiT, partial [Dehalococcoidales bacterium]|nr:precorrin-6Y C5,15-methyltransferase (decarboxylating) subunit CbiT [Dehalococcoidales bacterium]